MHGYAKALGREQDPIVTVEDGLVGREKQVITHPAFAKIAAHRVSGMTNLFGVDYPQQHYITLSIKRAELNRDGSRDWTYTKGEIIEVALSEVQWAQMLSGMNTEGVECTLTRLTRMDALPVGMIPAIPPRATEADLHQSEVKDAADRTMAKVREAYAALSRLAAASGTIPKGELRAALATLSSGINEATDTLPFVVESAQEAIEDNAVRAKGEVSAFLGHAMQQLGERSIGAALAFEASQGRDPKQALLDMIAPPAPEDERG